MHLNAYGKNLETMIERYSCDQNRNTEARSLTFVASSVVIIFMRVCWLFHASRILQDRLTSVSFIVTKKVERVSLELSIET